ncbi:YezD family protein [Sphingopyxis sp. FBM22]|nr:YezD family protein [Sphingopyxis yananensis]
MRSIKEDERSDHDQASRAIQTVLDALQKLRFGSIQMTIHEGRLVQVDVTERSRFTNAS